ncbi:MAG: hypothetical protein SVR04_08440 [Spirochaetota bacterium]|nr:hypothetical protein [Spirochaetota bacterium]
MIDKVHEHIIDELRINTRTDRIFVLAAISLNIVTLGTNAAIAAGGPGRNTNIVMFIFIALIIVINVVAEIGLIKGRQTRTKLLSGLIKMYKDKGVEQYYAASLLQAYTTRYNLFMLVVLFTGIVAVIVPFFVL